MHETLPKMAKKTKENFIVQSFESCGTCKMSFDLWMFKGRINVFVLIVHVLNYSWEPCHATIKLFEIVDIFKHAMALQVNQILWMHGLNAKSKCQIWR